MSDKGLCRCGKPAPLDVSISATPPFDPSRTPRSELHFSAIACRACAFEAAKLLLSFLESQGNPS